VKIAEVAEMFSSDEQKYSSEDVVCDVCHGSVVFIWAPNCPIRKY
jgi:hypothetical protein